VTKFFGGFSEAIIRWVFEGPVGQASRFFRHDYNVVDIVYKRAVERSALIVEKHMHDAIGVRSKKELWNYCANIADPSHVWLEFGVYRGTSINYLSRFCSRIYGFDSFEGLAEDWRGNSLAKGAFNLDGRLPKVGRNVTLVKGFFNETLETFLVNKKNQRLGLVHLDCDTFDSTSYVLEHLGIQRLKGCVVIFDDFFGAPGFEMGQYRALNDLLKKNKKLKCSYLAYSRQSVAVMIND